MPVKVEVTKADVVVYMHGPCELDAWFCFPEYAQKWCASHKCTWLSGDYVVVKVPEGGYEIVRFDAREVKRVAVYSEEGTVKVRL